MTALHELGVIDAAAALRGGQISSVELTRALLDRIGQLEPSLKAWVTLDEQGALARAAAADARRALGGNLPPLLGVPYGLKDIYLTQTMPTTAGFGPLADWVAGRNASCVDRLAAAGAVLVGKTVTTQFATADPPPTRNPWNASRTPGGSSSGSAAAVAARMVPAAVGSQTGGSILRPAGYCGVVGIKPSYGLVSRRDVLPLAWTLDHPGPMARSVADAALMLEVMAGYDPGDPASRAAPVPALAAAAARPRKPRLGLLTDVMERSQPDVRAHIQSAATKLISAGALVEETTLPRPFDVFFAVHRLTMQSEAAAVHLFGIAEQRDHYSPRIRSEAMVGQLVPAPIYLHSQRVRRQLVAAMDDLFAQYDALLLPTASNVAPDPDTTGDMSFQALASLMGTPAISLPSGLNADGLPFATQLIAGRFEEARLIGAAAWCEQALAFRAAPPLG
ncbi:MAG: amidase [Chloroflexota bacterium]